MEMVQEKQEGERLRNMSKLCVVDLFCGAGGMSKGLEMAGFEVLMGIDVEPVFIETYKTNHLTAAEKSFAFDIRHISGAYIKQELTNKTINLIAGGPPCQGFSLAGKRDPNDPRNALFMSFVRIVNDIQPEWFVTENVPGLLSMVTAKGDSVSDLIISEFEHIGYRVKQFKLLAADYGVPQKRKRIFFIGNRLGKPIKLPTPTHAKTATQTLIGGRIEKWVPVRACLLPESEIPKVYYHSEKMIEGFKKRKERNRQLGKGWGWQKLDLDQPSYTITAQYGKDGGAAVVPLVNGRTRMLTERECARVQSFPDDYIFHGSKKNVYTQIGNAVPPLVAKAVGISILKYL